MKLKLNLEDLGVESFETAGARDAAGTVHGHAITEPETFQVNDMCTAGCTEYCETDGGGAGYTCDVRCYSRQNCDTWACGGGSWWEPTCQVTCYSDVAYPTCGADCSGQCTGPQPSGCTV